MRWPWSKPHQWSDWIVTDLGKISYCRDIVGWYAVQERYCRTCGKTQVEEQAEYAQAPRSMCARHSTMPSRTPRKDKVTS